MFYSWQSDLPKETNLNGIRQALRVSANEVENLIENISVELDEANNPKRQIVQKIPKIYIIIVMK